MTIKEAQERVDEWIKTYGVRYFSELTNMAVLTEEVGELARVMARKYGDQSFKKGENTDPSEEMADILWLPGQPDGRGSDRGAGGKLPQEDRARQDKTHKQP